LTVNNNIHGSDTTFVVFISQWLTKIAAAGRTTKTDNSDAVDMEEMNPLWLKDKGRYST
jgi:hypothetical protein